MKKLIAACLTAASFSTAAWAGCAPCFDYCPGEKPSGCCGGRPNYLACSDQRILQLLHECDALKRQKDMGEPLEQLLQTR